MSKLIDKLSVYFALFGVAITPVITWCTLHVTTRPGIVSIAMQLPERKPIIKIYEFRPDEKMPPAYNRYAYEEQDDQYIVNVHDRPDKKYTKNDLRCMALNIYFEAYEESIKGQLAVGLVTLNRVKSPYYPNTVCGVVYQHKQFSWYWDGKSDRPKYPRKYETALLLASSLLDQESNIFDFTYGADHYHADYVNPYWSHDMIKVVKIDTHIFYRDPSL